MGGVRIVISGDGCSFVGVTNSVMREEWGTCPSGGDLGCSAVCCPLRQGRTLFYTVVPTSWLDGWRFLVLVPQGFIH